MARRSERVYSELQSRLQSRVTHVPTLSTILRFLIAPPDPILPWYVSLTLNVAYNAAESRYTSAAE